MEFFLSAGIVLGLSAGFSPGPLTTLVISQSLQHGAKEGLKVALAPGITDLPIIILSVFALTRLSDFQGALGLISIVGGLFLVYLAYMSFVADKIDVDAGPAEPRSFGKGTIVNLFNPSPYVFWLTVGGPTVVAAWAQSPLRAVLFLAGFYACLIGAKMCLAVTAARSRQFLTGKAYSYVMRILGVLLLVLALLLFRDGMGFLGISWP
ncbi:MAG: LysE family translocator [Thermodesulfobacteriota bacterium]